MQEQLGKLNLLIRGGIVIPVPKGRWGMPEELVPHDIEYFVDISGDNYSRHIFFSKKIVLENGKSEYHNSDFNMEKEEGDLIWEALRQEPDPRKWLAIIKAPRKAKENYTHGDDAMFADPSDYGQYGND
jgi:hypothetical protein